MARPAGLSGSAQPCEPASHPSAAPAGLQQRSAREVLQSCGLRALSHQLPCGSSAAAGEAWAQLKRSGRREPAPQRAGPAAGRALQAKP